MFQCKRGTSKLFLYAYSLFCFSSIVGCSSPGGSYNLGQADAQISGLEARFPELRKDLTSIRDNLIAANQQIQQKEASIVTLTKMLDSAQEQSKSRLLWIWKLTSGLLSLLLVVGIYLAWKLK